MYLSVEWDGIIAVESEMMTVWQKRLQQRAVFSGH